MRRAAPGARASVGAIALAAATLVGCSAGGGSQGLEGLEAASEALAKAGITCALAPGGSAVQLAEAELGSVEEAGFCVIDRSTLHLVVVDGPAAATRIAIDQQRKACEVEGDDVTLVRGYNWLASLRPPARGLGRTLATSLDGNVLVTTCSERPPIPPRRLPVGESAPLGAFDVRVTEVDTDAEERVLALDPTNEPASDQWVLATYEATNVAQAPAVAYESLTPSVVAEDGETTYAPGPCGQQASPKTPTAVGGTVTLVACFDLPRDVIETGSLRIVGRDVGLWRLM